MNKTQVNNNIERLIENKIRESFLSYCEIEEFKLSKEEEGRYKIIIKVDSNEIEKRMIDLNDKETKEFKNIEKKEFSNKQKNEEFFIFYAITIILSYFKALIKQRIGVFIKYLSYIYSFVSNIYGRGAKIDEKYKISEYLFLIIQVILKKIKTIDDKYMIDQKIRNFNSKYNILNTLQEKERIIIHNFQYTMNTETGNKIQVFYTKLRKKCRNIHEEACKLANLKEKVKIQ
ncbi:hypothetical protein T552_00754 [Pneumocystis carinii B80]|uniref:Uncharacterized protein n=1 Tax=Pneumocystis carinii (strain B80) TaxID=1408658 RepID=A0A0W4ZPG8_PNEC8|nr:hypothetical protein T552_00754 [Pneumocystis carinii B80]KTW30279.1 hypothetical protein T552_00754 [Pneumocystis carinii B80]